MSWIKKTAFVRRTTILLSQKIMCCEFNWSTRQNTRMQANFFNWGRLTYKICINKITKSKTVIHAHAKLSLHNFDNKETLPATRKRKLLKANTIMVSSTKFLSRNVQMLYSFDDFQGYAQKCVFFLKGTVHFSWNNWKLR